jgi:Tol biopolymer transport system component
MNKELPRRDFLKMAGVGAIRAMLPNTLFQHDIEPTVRKQEHEGFTGQVAYVSSDKEGMYEKLHVANTDYSEDKILWDIKGDKINSISWSPEAQKLAFTTNNYFPGSGVKFEDADSKLIIYDQRVGIKTLETAQPGIKYIVDWIPNSQCILYQVLKLPKGDRSFYQLRVLDVSNGTDKFVLSLANYPIARKSPSVSPDGSKIAISYHTYEIYYAIDIAEYTPDIKNANDRAQERIYDGIGLTMYRDPDFHFQWSADSRRIFYTVLARNADSGGYIFDLDTKKIRKVSSRVEANISPDGTAIVSPGADNDWKLYYIDYDKRSNVLYQIFDPQTGELVHEITDDILPKEIRLGQRQDRIPIWSKDGSRIGLHISNNVTDKEYFVTVNPDGTNIEIAEIPPSIAHYTQLLEYSAAHKYNSFH